MEHARVCVANTKAQVSECTLECVVPLPPGLLQSVQGLLEVFDHAIIVVVSGLVLWLALNPSQAGAEPANPWLEAH